MDNMSSDCTSAETIDPRDSKLPISLPALETVSETTLRVLAPNPSPMTLDGTNTYVIFSDDFSSAVVIDPGPSTKEHIEVLESVVSKKGAKVRGIYVTHTHIDHAEAVAKLVRRWNVKAYAHPNVCHLGYEPVVEGRSITNKVALDTIFTPGHSGDHMCFMDQSGNLMSGDHILGRGTTVVAHPDGDLARYLDSLERMVKAEYRSIQPGHGPAMDRELGQEVVKYYISHRRARLSQILDALGQLEGLVTVGVLVRSIYGELKDPILWAATATTLAALTYLVSQGKIVQQGDSYRLFS